MFEAVGIGVKNSFLLDTGVVISQMINVFGLLIIVRGVVKCLKRWILDEYKIIFQGRHVTMLMHVRRDLAIYLLLGLEFIVASDIIDTMLHLDLQKLILLGGLIVIRIVIGFTLDKEIKEYEERHEHKHHKKGHYKHGHEVKIIA